MNLPETKVIGSPSNVDPILPPDDPILDNNFYSAMLQRHPTATKFAQEYEGKMAITLAVQRQAGANRSFPNRLVFGIRSMAVRSRYGIRVVRDPSEAEVNAITRQVNRPLSAPGSGDYVDIAQIAAAQKYGVGLATGDNKLFKNALTVLDPLDADGNAALHYRVFGNDPQIERATYQKMIDYINLRKRNPKLVGLPPQPSLRPDLDPYLLTGRDWLP